MTPADLLEILDNLKKDEFRRFKWYLKDRGFMAPYPAVTVFAVEVAERTEDTVDLMVNTFGPDGAVQVTRKVLQKIPRNDLVQRLPDTSSGAGDVMALGVPASSPQERAEHGGHLRQRAGLMRDSCQLTIDTNTVNTHLQLSHHNRKVTCVEEEQAYPDHPDRFQDRPQLLCTTGLTGRCYWEVEWTGDVEIAVSYRGIGRGGGEDCVFGWSDQSWILMYFDGRYYVSHNNDVTPLSPAPSSGRVAVYVDHAAGSLSFYRVSSDTLTHLHTFSTTFTQPLYPGFGFWSEFSTGSSVSLCPLEDESPPV